MTLQAVRCKPGLGPIYFILPAPRPPEMRVSAPMESEGVLLNGQITTGNRSFRLPTRLICGVLCIGSLRWRNSFVMGVIGAALGVYRPPEGIVCCKAVLMSRALSEHRSHCNDAPAARSDSRFCLCPSKARRRDRSPGGLVEISCFQLRVLEQWHSRCRRHHAVLLGLRLIYQNSSHCKQRWLWNERGIEIVTGCSRVYSRLAVSHGFKCSSRAAWWNDNLSRSLHWQILSWELFSIYDLTLTTLRGRLQLKFKPSTTSIDGRPTPQYFCRNWFIRLRVMVAMRLGCGLFVDQVAWGTSSVYPDHHNQDCRASCIDETYTVVCT